MRGITLAERQNEKLEVFRRHTKPHGIPPSRSKLRKALGIGNQARLKRVLSALATKRWGRLVPAVDRGIRLLREAHLSLTRMTSRKQLLTTPWLAKTIRSPSACTTSTRSTERFEARPNYFLRVKGDSIDLVGFRPSDVVAVRKGGDPRNGDVVVARIGEDITLKRYYRGNGYGRIELQPVSSNDDHSKNPIDGYSDFEICGIVVGAIIGTRRDWTVI